MLAAAVGTNTRVHSHLARHTFATRMLRMGVKIENLSKMLGHCAADLCRALGYNNGRDAIARHCDEGDVVKRDTPTTSGTNITQTQKYAKVMALSVHDDFDMVAGKLAACRQL